MRLKLGLAVSVVALCLAAFAATAAPSSAATGGIPISTTTCVTASGGTCAVTLTGFQVANGVLQGVFQVTDSVTGAVLATVTSQVAGGTGSCSILDLTVGPIHLDLLGLVVDTNTIHLQITAQQGPGNLLGNLLCGLAHALDGGGSLTQISNILNRLLGGGLLGIA